MRTPNAPVVLLAGSIILSTFFSEALLPSASAAHFKDLLANASKRNDSAPLVIREKWALLIGVDSFQDPSVPKLTANARNVADLAATLKNPNAGRFAPDHVVTLTGAKATKSGIEQVINDWLMKKALPDDLVLLYISSASIAGANGEPMVFSYDTLGSEPELSAIDLRQLATDIKRRIQSRNIILVVDASPAQATGPDFAALCDLGISVITAASGNQKSIVNGALNTSVFEHHFAEALKHSAGGLTLQQIFDHLNSTVPQDAQTCFNAKQTPLLALAPTNPLIGGVALGMAVKSSMKTTVSIGHPIDKLALSRPDLILPKGGNTPTSSVPAIAAASHVGEPAAVAKTALKAKPADDDDDDDDKPREHVDFGSYMAKMKQDIQKNWKPPKGLESRKLVAVFTITREGKIVNPTIVEGSGVEAIDKSAMDALAAASPLDPLPKGSPRSIDIKYKFDWTVRQESAPEK